MNLSEEMTDVNFASKFGMTVPVDFLLWFANLAATAEKLQDDANKLQCLEEAGIDNVEAYSIGMDIYYERYPEKDEFA